MSMVGSQSAQAQTQVRIDTVTWDDAAPTFKLLIRNTGSVSATIESISIRPNTAGSTATTYQPTNPAAIDVGVTLDTGTVPGLSTAVTYKWSVSTSYVIRIVTTTGFYYEMVSTTPATGAPP
jgi:archaellum component FlaG (FlaF/FlaG flagellin family)